MSKKRDKISLDIKEEKIETVIEPIEETLEEIVDEVLNDDIVEEIVDEVVESVVEEPLEEPVKKSTKDKKEVVKSTIDYVGRGFSSLDEAKRFVETDYFKGLGKADQEEYLNWLNN